MVRQQARRSTSIARTARWRFGIPQTGVAGHADHTGAEMGALAKGLRQMRVAMPMPMPSVRYRDA
jgi:hypothetical protein